MVIEGAGTNGEVDEACWRIILTSTCQNLFLAILACEPMVAFTLPALLRGDTCRPIEARSCEAVVLSLGASRPLEPWRTLAEVRCGCGSANGPVQARGRGARSHFPSAWSLRCHRPRKCRCLSWGAASWTHSKTSIARRAEAPDQASLLNASG